MWDPALRGVPILSAKSLESPGRILRKCRALALDTEPLPSTARLSLLNRVHLTLAWRLVGGTGLSRQAQPWPANSVGLCRLKEQ